MSFVICKHYPVMIFTCAAVLAKEKIGNSTVALFTFILFD